MVFLQAALNGEREHPAAPRSPAELAEDTQRVVEAGAHSVHVHAFDEDGRETLDPRHCDAVIKAIRRAVTKVPISLTTSSGIEADPGRRLSLVTGWTELPDLVTANQGEPGIVELSEYLMERGVGIEAGLLSVDDAEHFVRWPRRDRCTRILVEPLDADPQDALRHATMIERIVCEAGVRLEQVHHGRGIASWAVNARALERGHGIRTGLEDTPVMPDGRTAKDNAALVRSAVRLIGRAR